MKSKFLKLGMPLLAFLLAIVFAFATEPGTAKENSSLVTGYIYNHDQSDCISTTKDCTTTAGPVCTVDGQPVFRFKNGTSCLMQLYEWTP